MAPPRAVAKNLRRTAQRLGKVRVAVVAEAADAGIAEAAARGGRFRFGSARRASPLYATVVEPRNKGTTSSVKVVGVPVGAWVIKSYGRAGGYDIRARDGGPLNLRTAGTNSTAAESVHIGAATTGDGRWDRVVEAMEKALPEVAEIEVGRALDG